MVSKSNQNSCLVFTKHRTPNAIRLDAERNLIGHRTQSDRTANASGGTFPLQTTDTYTPKSRKL